MSVEVDDGEVNKEVNNTTKFTRRDLYNIVEGLMKALPPFLLGNLTGMFTQKELGLIPPEEPEPIKEEVVFQYTTIGVKDAYNVIFGVTRDTDAEPNNPLELDNAKIMMLNGFNQILALYLQYLESPATNEQLEEVAKVLANLHDAVGDIFGWQQENLPGSELDKNT